jgi:hypothetical protein
MRIAFACRSADDHFARRPHGILRHLGAVGAAARQAARGHH